MNEGSTGTYNILELLAKGYDLQVILHFLPEEAWTNGTNYSRGAEQGIIVCGPGVNFNSHYLKGDFYRIDISDNSNSETVLRNFRGELDSNIQTAFSSGPFAKAGSQDIFYILLLAEDKDLPELQKIVEDVITCLKLNKRIKLAIAEIR